MPDSTVMHVRVIDLGGKLLLLNWLFSAALLAFVKVSTSLWLKDTTSVP